MAANGAAHVKNYCKAHAHQGRKQEGPFCECNVLLCEAKRCDSTGDSVIKDVNLHHQLEIELIEVRA